MTATAAAVKPKRTSGPSTWRRASSARRSWKLDRKTHRTNCSNIFRWYRAGWGRYTQADPILGSDPNANYVYGYAKQNPLSYTDPTGLLAEAICSEIATNGTNTPFYHCRLRVTCKECTGGNYGGPFDT